MFETVAVDNANSWISGGSFLGVLSSLIWCKLKIKSQCTTIMELKTEMKNKAEKDSLVDLKADNKEDHRLLFDKIDKLPEKIILLMKK